MTIAPSEPKYIDLAYELARPGKAERLRRLMEPFRGNPPKPPRLTHELMGDFKKAIFWQKIDSFQPISQPSLSLPKVKLQDSLDTAFGRRIKDRLSGRHLDLLRQIVGEQTHGFVGQLHRSTLGPFNATLLYASAFVLADQPAHADQFHKLLELWSKAYKPIGFNDETLVLHV